jgi:hypothetical protein
MTPEFPRPDGVGGRAPTTGASSHHNGSRRDYQWPHDPPDGFAIYENEDFSMYVIAYAACALSGFLVGVLVGALIL